jgi:hypothetical protein
MVRVHVPAGAQQAPVMHELGVQAVPVPWNVWFDVAAHPAMVLLEQTPAVEQQAPTRGVHGEGEQAAPLPMYVSPDAPQAPVAPLPRAGLGVQVAPSELQQAPVGTVQGFGTQTPPEKVLGRAQAVLETIVQAPLGAQHAPAITGHGPQALPRPWKLDGKAALAAVMVPEDAPVVALA